MTNNRKHKPVGFYSPIAPPVWNAPEFRSLDVNFVRMEWNFFPIQETQMQKMMDQNFEIWILWFLRIFWNFQKGVTQPIWTIMVAAKLDQSRVLVTKFCQNWLTLKGRSAGQRHTVRQPLDRQTWLKIMALQVCNRANKKVTALTRNVGQCPTWWPPCRI